MPILALVALCSTLAAGQDSVTLVEDGNFKTALPASWTSQQVHPELQKLKEKGFPNALHLDVDVTHRDAALFAKSTAMVHLGDTVAIRVWIRGAGNPALSFGSSGGLIVEGHAKLTPKWKEYRFAAESKEQLLAGDGQFAIRFKDGGEWADLAKLRVEDLGDATPESIRPTHS